MTLQLEKMQTQQICLAAIKESGLALEYVKEQTPEICLAAIKQNKSAKQYSKFEIKTIFDLLLENKNNIEQLKKYMNNIEKYNKDCLICRNNENTVINLRCCDKYDHCYCVECFCEWYKNNGNFCVACMTQFDLKDEYIVYK